jgi:hypothetical protein
MANRSNMQILAGCAALISIAGCSSRPFDKSDIKKYTSIELCSAASVQDLTAREEYDTIPAFSYHVSVEMPHICVHSFLEQLAMLSPRECSPERVESSGCFVQDAFPSASKHTTITIRPTGSGRFDMRFVE